MTNSTPKHQPVIEPEQPHETAVFLESERRRIAQQLNAQVIDPLNLLLAQINAYEQTLAAGPNARMALSVLAALARQALQQARDLENDLYPTLLYTLGLVPALETLANRIQRTHGVSVQLHLAQPLPQLRSGVALPLFRAAQSQIQHVIEEAQATEVTLELTDTERQVSCRIVDNGRFLPRRTPSAAETAVYQLDGRIKERRVTDAGCEYAIHLPLAPSTQLTPREMDVIRLLARGMSNKEIGGTLAISPRTVNFHLDNIYGKLGVHSRTEAAVFALQQGWIDAGER